MSAANFMEYVVLAMAVGGLVAVLAEVVLTDPELLGGMMVDVRSAAEPA